MEIPHDAVRLRIFLGESDRWEHQPLYEAIVLQARAAHLAGRLAFREPLDAVLPDGPVRPAGKAATSRRTPKPRAADGCSKSGR